MDVKLPFANRLPHEDIYVQQLEGFVQTLRAWYSRIDEHLISLGFISLITKFKQDIMIVSVMTELKLTILFIYFIMEIKQNQEDVKGSMPKNFLKKFHIEECKIMGTPMNPNEKLSQDDRDEKLDE
ncbi:Retrovirus-related Pol polyprotein from transposon TNT 1-94 [Gossypium australe]|uniref:Retrovirus-related Pol polyprotein from transposon TNT 1-94 n=1 Tax=Gossypium australe TaxID=47621 RepID=A0A5B6VJ51_9ROSI|nr:Retrovirus-related Pol polyprotein from transposon TNT 1-94 [Gossypium australe]